MPFLTVCLNPTIQKTLCFSSVAPGMVNRTAVHRLDVSGKGINVTRVLTQLGKKAVHLSQLGGELRPLFLSLCEQDGLFIEWVESRSPIRFCYTILTKSGTACPASGNSETVITELVEESQPVGGGTEDRLLQRFDAIINKQTPSYMIVSGTKAAGYSDELIPGMVRKAKEKGIKTILDIRGKDLINSLQYQPDIIKPNLFEFADTFALTETDKAQVKAAMLDVIEKYGCRIILTDGGGIIRAADSGGPFEIEIQPVNAVNTIGCGDAFTAGLASALDEGASFKEAINEGIRCGALNAMLIKPGVIT